jgi:lysozyme
MKASDACISLIKKFETLHDGDLSHIGLQPKMCPAGYWTIGWGHVVMVGGRMLKGKADYELAYHAYSNLSLEGAEELLRKDIEFFEDVLNSLKLNLSQNQFDALISLSFNIGSEAFRKSTLKKLIAGKAPKEAIQGAFMSWVYATIDGRKQKLKGLIRRREEEAKMYFLN